MGPQDEPIWPVDLPTCRLWPMEGEDGPLLQELFDDLTDFETAFGDRGRADAVSTYVALPEGVGYEAKLLIGCWWEGALVGAVDCIVGYPEPDAWAGGLLVVAQRHRGRGIGTAVLDWLERAAAARGARRLSWAVRDSNTAGAGFLQRRGYALTRGDGATTRATAALPVSGAGRAGAGTDSTGSCSSARE